MKLSIMTYNVYWKAITGNDNKCLKEGKNICLDNISNIILSALKKKLILLHYKK